MMSTLKSRLRRMRFTLVGVLAALTTALIITPAHAASSLGKLEGGVVAAVCVIGILLFALVFEIWHFTRHKQIPQDSMRNDRRAR